MLNGTPLQYSRLANPMDGGAWWAAVHGVANSWTRLRDFTFTFHLHALEKEMATHSSVLAWGIPGTGSLVGCRLWGRTESDTTEATAAAAAAKQFNCSFQGSSVMFSAVDAWIYIPTNSAQGFSSLHILVNSWIFFITAIQQSKN